MKASGHSPPTKPGQHKQAAKQSAEGRRGRTTAASAGCRHERIRATAFVHLAIAVVVDTVAADLTLPGVYPAIVVVAVPVFGRDPVAVQITSAQRAAELIGGLPQANQSAALRSSSPLRPAGSTSHTPPRK